MGIYFISDTHFNHPKDFLFKPRGFSNIVDHDTALINNWNATVGENDDIYVLGDFILGADTEYVNRVLSCLKGKIHLIRGNHDTDRKVAIYEASDKVVEICWATQIKYNKRLFYLSHYPTMSAANTEKPIEHMIVNLFGHTHSRDKFYEDDNPFMYNVAADAHNCTPVSIDDIIADIDAAYDSVNLSLNDVASSINNYIDYIEDIAISGRMRSGEKVTMKAIPPNRYNCGFEVDVGIVENKISFNYDSLKIMVHGRIKDGLSGK